MYIHLKQIIIIFRNLENNKNALEMAKKNSKKERQRFLLVNLLLTQILFVGCDDESGGNGQQNNAECPKGCICTSESPSTVCCILNNIIIKKLFTVRVSWPRLGSNTNNLAQPLWKTAHPQLDNVNRGKTSFSPFSTAHRIAHSRLSPA